MTTKQKWQRLASVLKAVEAPGGRARYGTCAVEGTRIVQRALRAGAHFEGALVSRRFADHEGQRSAGLRQALAEHGCLWMQVPDRDFARLTEGRDLGGILALARIPCAPRLADVMALPAPGPRHFLACVSFNDPGNVGALVRTAHAGGVAAVLAIDATDAFHPKSVRTSMGSVFRIPVIPYPDLASMAAQLAAAGARTVGSVTSGGGAVTELGQCEGATALVLGPEAFGLSREQQGMLDELVTIPMPGEIDSLSVNAAAAILLHELRRPRLIDSACG